MSQDDNEPQRFTIKEEQNDNEPQRFTIEEEQNDNEPQRFTIEEEQNRLYRRFNAKGTQLTVRLLPPPEGDEDPNPMSNFLDSVTELLEHALRDHEDSDMIGITISNEVKNRAIGISFRRKDQITGDVIWSVFEKVAAHRMLGLML